MSLLATPATSQLELILSPFSMNLLENHFWNEENWSSKYVGVVPRNPLDSEV